MRLASLLLLLAALSAPAAPADKPLRINLGTLAPRGSSYHQALQGMGEAWRRVLSGADTANCIGA